MPANFPKPNSQKIDVYQSYPCPLCHGSLHLITLTEALGCDRCHLIFVTQEDDYALTQVGSSERTWYWWGETWQPRSKIVKQSRYFTEVTLAKFIVLVGTVVILCLLAKTPEFLLGLIFVIILLWICWRLRPHNL
ncbi:hypothetical protein Syn7502_02654 [Synechococcus sp. PCC 7502]|uniref:DUF2396 family protein n=1 Tax=Synechococcus sp. PCC 7502 TaxID=1173263 RepID=UPI00029F9203|nr:DUF2396 family protein [Synechococcus sp. PCC 7502]AFY74613.1 hypothetical protein Syn7502_02654 [Synechococcus sp. PCC 7502]